METWRDISRSSRTAALELFGQRRWRSFASRAYYAVYSEISYGLIKAGVSMPSGWNNPHHLTLPKLVGEHLTPLRMQARWRLAGLVAKLYTFRITADYRPHMAFDEPDARIVFAVMAQAFDILKDIP